MRSVKLLAISWFLFFVIAPYAHANQPQSKHFDKACPVGYVLTPDLRGNEPTLRVQITICLDHTGVLHLRLPDESQGEHDRWRYITDLEITGGQIQEDGPARRTISSTPGARILLKYRVHSAYSDDPTDQNGNPYHGAIVLPTWMATLGDFIFALPELGDNHPATYKWGPIPKGWKVSSNLDPISTRGRFTLSEVMNSSFLAGQDIILYSRPLHEGTLKVAMRGNWAFSPDTFVNDIASVINFQRGFWGKMPGSFSVQLIPLNTSPGHGITFGGTARFRGFTVYANANTDEDGLKRLLAHEHTHSWIPVELGTVPDAADEPSVYWLSEGFTDYYADKTLLRSGQWNVDHFVKHFNGILREYGESSVNRAPNSLIVSDFWKKPEVHQLPYERGYLIAFMLDREIRKESRERANLDRTMFKMRDVYMNAPEGSKPDIVTNFVNTVRSISGLNVGDDLTHYIVEGNFVHLPEDLFGNCVKISTVTIPRFYVGFDGRASLAKGVFVGVDPAGPAFKAGLRDGMRRIDREGGDVSDSRVEISLRVVDEQGEERLIRFKPEGKETVSFQEATWTTEDESQRRRCEMAIAEGTDQRG